MKFSERIGKNKKKSIIQIDTMDSDLKNSIWNVLDLFIIKEIRESHSLYASGFKMLIEKFWFSFLKKPLDRIPSGVYNLTDEIRDLYFKWDYLEVYDFIDFIVQEDCPFDKTKFIDLLNFVLNRELSGYKFILGKLSPITNELEIEQIEQAVNNSKLNKFKGVAIHLESALDKISNRENPDYRNSIKESISAVESLCQILTDEKGAELGKTLKLLKSKMPLHGALQQGFTKLYGYTSDSNGIRHAMLDSDILEKEDALYMLVTCSAFINYLTIKADKLNLIKN